MLYKELRHRIISVSKITNDLSSHIMSYGFPLRRVTKNFFFFKWFSFDNRYRDPFHTQHPCALPSRPFLMTSANDFPLPGISTQSHCKHAVFVNRCLGYHILFSAKRYLLSRKVSALSKIVWQVNLMSLALRNLLKIINTWSFDTGCFSI